MPELPEVETTRLALSLHAEGGTLTAVSVRTRQLRWPVPTTALQKLRGQALLSTGRRGKYLLLHFEEAVLIIHLGMSGRLRILKKPTPPTKHDHLDFVFDDRLTVRYQDPRKFGSVHLTGRHWQKHRLLYQLGPEPNDLKAGDLKKRAQGRKVAIKNFLMDSRMIAGIGNIYATESLFAAGIHPMRPVGRLSEARFVRLVKAIRIVLNKAIRAGGTTLKDFLQPGGETGYFAVKLLVYGREGLPCSKCKTPLKNIRLAGRSTVYCPQCQR